MLEFLKILHLVIHYSSHLLLPWLIAWVFLGKMESGLDNNDRDNAC